MILKEPRIAVMLRSKPLWPTYHATSVSSEHYDYDIKIKKTVLNLSNLRAGDESGRGLEERVRD